MNLIRKSWKWKKVHIYFNKHHPYSIVNVSGNDALLIDFTNTNNLGGGGIPQPPGFVGYPMPPPLPNLPMDPYPYRVRKQYNIFSLFLNSNHFFV